MKTTIYVFMAFAMLSVVSAATVDCGEGSFWNPWGKYCEADEVQPAIDDVSAQIVETDEKVDNLSLDVSAQNSYIAVNEAGWLHDGGTGMSHVKEFLFGGFLDYLKTIFVTKDDFAVSEASQILGLDADNDKITCYAAKLRSLQTGENHKIGDHTYYVKSGLCLKI